MDEDTKNKLYSMQLQIDIMDTKLNQWIEKWKKQEADMDDIKRRIRAVQENKQERNI
jgi:hypothetical protein